MDGLYSFVKALHVISIIAWMAGLLYLPRLFVYHASAAKGSELSETLKIMERRLLRAIATPAMIASWLFGLYIVLFTNAIDFAVDIWFHVKLVFVMILSGFHGFCAKWRKDFENDSNQRPAVFYRIANEVPTVLMIGIVFLVIVRPF